MHLTKTPFRKTHCLTDGMWAFWKAGRVMLSVFIGNTIYDMLQSVAHHGSLLCDPWCQLSNANQLLKWETSTVMFTAYILFHQMYPKCIYILLKNGNIHQLQTWSRCFLKHCPILVSALRWLAWFRKHLYCFFVSLLILNFFLSLPSLYPYHLISYFM